MDRRKLAVACVLAAAFLIIPYMVLPETPAGQYTYVPSNTTEANPNIRIGQTAGPYMIVSKISQVKDEVVLTVSGTVISVGDTMVWEYKGDTYGAVPVTIDVDKKTKDERPGHKLERGDRFTFYLQSYLHPAYPYGYGPEQYYIFDFDAQFEIGEHVLVHIRNDDRGPDGEYGDNYFVVLGDIGKYRIHEGRAYNEKYSEGRPLSDAFNEAI